MEVIQFNVGGHYYSTSLTTLKTVPDNLLIKMVESKIPVVKDENKIFIDRDGDMFKHILNYLRNPNIWTIPDNVDKNQLKSEADFYLLSSLVKDLEKSMIKPKTVINCNVSFTCYIRNYSNASGSKPVYAIQCNQKITGAPDFKIDISKHDLDKEISNFILKFNEAGYRLVTTTTIEMPQLYIYYFEKYQ